MPMGYNPQKMDESSGGGRAEPGTYRFTVEDACERSFRSGNEGTEVKLTVAAFRDRDISVRDYFVYGPTTLWKLKQFFASIGCDFDHPPEAYELVGCTGRARFNRDAESGYLRIAEYLEAQQQAPTQQQQQRQQGTQQRQQHAPSEGAQQQQRPPQWSHGGYQQGPPPQRAGGGYDGYPQDNVPF